MAAHDTFLQANDSFLKVIGGLSTLTLAENRLKKLSVPTRIQPCRKLPQAVMQANKNFLKVAGGLSPLTRHGEPAENSLLWKENLPSRLLQKEKSIAGIKETAAK
ncbi:MAG: hypothetical protein ACLSWS_18675, partial [Faecalispora jeddahensis]